MLFVIAILLSSILVACGDDKAVIPTYSGATSVPVPDAFKSTLTGLESSVTSPNAAAYKSSDAIDKVKSGLADGFKSNGWDDASSQLGDTASSLSALGSGTFLTAYAKGNNFAVVFGVPGSDVVRLMGFDAKDGETVFLIVSGTAKGK
jgi:hypothetical protein